VGDRALCRREITASNKGEPMRLSAICALLVAGALPVSASAEAASLPRGYTASDGIVVDVGARRYVRERDCTPYNGPYGFYGNIWCQPPNKESYLRNLGAHWPQETPPSLKYRKPSSYSTDW
jgi:hypothetical protein